MGYFEEAAYLAGMPYKKDGITTEEADELISRLRKIGPKSVIIKIM